MVLGGWVFNHWCSCRHTWGVHNWCPAHWYQFAHRGCYKLTHPLHSLRVSLIIYTFSMEGQCWFSERIYIEMGFLFLYIFIKLFILTASATLFHLTPPVNKPSINQPTSSIDRWILSPKQNSRLILQHLNNQLTHNCKIIYASSYVHWNND